MQYKNPVLIGDYKDPDVLRVGDDFYMVSSSFNRVPGIPVLHSKNLVEWELINYVLEELPFEKFGSVCSDDGAIAPSLRYHNGKFYCLVSFPGEGVYVSETDDIYGKWSLLRPLLTGEGYRAPCPLWHDGKCYVVVAFDKSRIGFDSKIAVFEADEELKYAETGYKFIYDGSLNAPGIGAPKFYEIGGYFYILAAVGGKRAGWTVALRSKNIYGPYESRIILMQGETSVHGPCGGALVELDGGNFALLHNQDLGAYGNAVNIQSAEISDGWIVCGDRDSLGGAGTPVESGYYPVREQTEYGIDPTDEFDGDKPSLLWQTPANRAEGGYALKHGMKLNCCHYGGNALYGLPGIFLQKISNFNFSVKTKCKLDLKNDGDEVGFVVYGTEYAYVCVVRRDGCNYLEIRQGKAGGASDETLAKSQPYDEDYVTFQLSAKRENPDILTYKFTFGGNAFTRKFRALREIGASAAIGIYARAETESKGSGLFKFFRVTCTDKRINAD